VTLVVSGALIGGLVESRREFFTSITQKHHDGHELADLFDPAASSPPELTRWERQRERETFNSYDSTAPSSKLLRYCTFEMLSTPYPASWRFLWGTLEFCSVRSRRGALATPI
jgi:hypothetical protein